jgi:radical SAM-linked protein
MPGPGDAAPGAPPPVEPVRIEEEEDGAREEMPAAADRPRLRVWYATGEPLRFLPHSDLMRVFHRAFRIAELEVVFSQGYSPRPRAAFGPPLPVGVTGAREAFDVEMTAGTSLDGDDIVSRLNAALPEGLRVLAVAPAPAGPAIAAAVVAADYRVALARTADRAAVAARLAAFQAADSMPVAKERHGRPDRTIDLKRAVLAATAHDGHVSFRLAVNQADGHQANASLVLAALFGLDQEAIAASRIARLALYDAEGPI